MSAAVSAATSKTLVSSKAKNKLYETEKALGPLPGGWERCETDDGKTFFVDHANKATTWIDPRTKKTRKTDITQITHGELPFGWEEAYDEGCGLYYIDHNTQSTYMDPPWDKRVQQHYKALREHLLKESKRLEQRKLLHGKVVKQLDGVDLFVAEIQKVKTQYRNQLQEFQQKFTDKPRIEKLQQILARIDVLSSDIEEYKKVVAKLQALDAVISLEGRQPGKITNHTIQEIHSLMETEDKKKDQFQQEASDLKRKLEELSRETPEPKRVEQTAAVAEKAPVIVQVRKQTSSTAVEEDHNILFETTNLTEEQRKKRLRLQMDLELLALKKILQAEQRAKLHPNKISEAMQREKDKLAENLGVVPDWIKKLNAYAMKSRTLRTQIGKAQKNNPDELSFTEKMLFFTAGAVEQVSEKQSENQ